MKTYLFIVILGFCLLKPASFRADIVYPARLELKETQPGVFQVLFILPVVNGKVLKAKPILPESCESRTDPVVSGDAMTKKLTWSIECPGESLYGKQIGIEGLQGSQIDILLIIEMLDGRSYNKKLSPVMAFFQVPYPPSFLELLKEGVLKGLRGFLSNPYTYLLFLGIILLPGFKNWRYSLLFFSIAVVAGYWLRFLEIIQVPEWMFGISVLIVTLISSLKFSSSATEFKNPSRTILVAVGILLGSILFSDNPELVLSPAGQVTISIFYSLGIIFGILLAVLLIWQLKEIFISFSSFEKTIIPISIFLGTISLGLLIYELSLFINTPAFLPQIPPIAILFVLSIPFIKGLLSQPYRILIFITFSILGLVLSMNSYNLKYQEIILLSAIIIFGINLLFSKTIPGFFLGILIGIGSIAAGNLMGEFAINNLSFPLARSMGYLFFCTFTIGIIASLVSERKKAGRRLRTGISAVFILIAFLLFLKFFADQHLEILANKYLNGILPLPVLTIFLILSALMLWPRHKKIHSRMNIRKPQPVLSLVFLFIAILVIPLTFSVKNPWFEAEDLDQEGMKLIVQNVLSNTYTAFNEEDEEKLFDELSKNIDSDLLDNIYLDSRRRLNMGLREGAEVSVQEVELDSLGLPNSPKDAESIEYPAEWTVTARVRHLKHIHYRKNKYIGTVALKAIDNKWKISKISLTSEDRKVIAASSL